MLLCLRELINTIVFIGEIFEKVTSLTLWLSFVIGHYIVKIGFCVFSYLEQTLSIILNVILVLYEDYCIFLIDVINKFKYLFSILHYGVQETISFTINLSTASKNITFTFYDLLCSYCSLFYLYTVKIFSFIMEIPGYVKGGLVLLGSGIWCCIQLIPLSVVYLTSMVLYFIGRMYDELTYVLYYYGKGLISLCANCVHFFIDIPGESCVGLIVGFVSIFLSLKYRVQILNTLRYNINQFYIFITRGFSSLEMRISNIFRNRRRLREESSEESINGEETFRTRYSPPEVNIERFSIPVQKTKIKSRATFNLSKLQRQLELEKESKLCVVCQDNERCVVGLPCHHLCLCLSCSTVISRQSGLCPICRHPLHRMMKVYV